MKVFRRRSIGYFCIWMLLCYAPVFVVTGCTQVREAEQIANIETIIAGTPSATPTTTPTLTPTATVGPTATPTATPSPTPTPFPPTPTTNPALQAFSFCNQQTDPLAQSRFSARLNQVSARGFPAFERIVVDFEVAPDSAPLNAAAHVLNERDFTLITGEPVAPGPYVVQVELPGWLHDEAFRETIPTETLTFTQTRMVSRVDVRYDTETDAGATIVVALNEPVPYRLSLTADRSQLLIEVALTSPLVESSDQLTLPLGSGSSQATAPLFFLLDGDIWRIDAPGVTLVPTPTSDMPLTRTPTGTPSPRRQPDRGAGPVNLTRSPAEELSLAVSPDGSMIAFCRALPGIDPSETTFAVPGTLWTMQADGSNPRQIAAVGINCDHPAFSPDGQTIVFSVDETGLSPVQRSIWSVPVRGGRAQRIAGGDEWSRGHPRWINAETLIYPANAQDGRSTLFLLRFAEDAERDIGADLVLDTNYRGFGTPLVAPDGRTIAIEALRSDNTGADLLLLDANGVRRRTLNEGYWMRPLAWSADGTLFYMTTICASTLIHDYTLHRYTRTGQEQIIAAGRSLGTIGATTALPDGLAYVTTPRPRPGPRGSGAIVPHGATSLWFWNLAEGTRGQLYSADRGIIQLEH